MKIKVEYKKGKAEIFNANDWAFTKEGTLEIIDEESDHWVIAEINKDIVKKVTRTK